MLLAGLMLAEKIVKLTRTKYDDIIIDIVGKGLKALLTRKR